MPKLTDMETHNMGGNFSFTGAKTDDLGASAFTLVGIAVDISGSTSGFETELRKMLANSVEACRKSPSKESLLIRALTFNTHTIDELHGFTPVLEINPGDYPNFSSGGGTPLNDATYSLVGSVASYGEKLYDDGYYSNAIIYIITDGAESGVSSMTPSEIKTQVEKIRQEEKLDSVMTILIGINVERAKTYLENFKNDAGFDHFIDAGDATPGKLAKVAAFVSQSVSSTSQALNTGGPSQNISATI